MPVLMVLAAAVLGTGCHEDCSLPIGPPPALTITVRDAVTFASVEGVTAQVLVGTFVMPNVSVFRNSVTAYLDKGAYTVVIRKEGYRDWTRTGLLIPRIEGCHSRGITLDAVLEPIS
jgi:hypothetical protein